MIRSVVALLAALMLAAPAPAQDADPASIAAQQDAMKKFAWMRGVWRGPAVTQTREGEKRVTQTERIGPFLDGTLIAMEGKGYRDDGTIGFHAFGVLSYDPGAKAYTLRSHALGHSGDFRFTPTDTGYVWEIPAGPATIRYTATFAAATWTEVGDYLSAGAPPRRFFRMVLERVGDTDWPEAGGIARD
ncbi:MAG: DUF1579 domain-containing protein [Sphingomonas sp.]